MNYHNPNMVYTFELTDFEFTLEFKLNVECFHFERNYRILYSFTVVFTALTSLLQDILINKFWSVVYSLVVL